MGWPSALTYRDIAARNVARSVGILACYGDVQTAAAVFAANPALADDPEALANAAGSGHEAFVRLMLQYQPALAQRIAVVARTRELTAFLFRNGMDPNRPDWLRITPLHRFAEQGAIENAAIFIDHGADLHARDEELSSTPLGYASKSGQTRMVEFLLRRGARPNLPDDPPWATPLAWATRRGHDDIVRLLTDHSK
jgi:ankyrin repeat protein